MSTETRTVEVHARRWFEQTNGNTYHAVRVVIDGETVAVVPFTYGYGTHYLHTAGLAIIEAGHPFGDLLEPAYGTANDGPSSRAYSLSSLFRWRAGDERPSFTDDDGTRWERADYVQDVPRRTDLVPDEWAGGDYSSRLAAYRAGIGQCPECSESGDHSYRCPLADETEEVDA